MVREGMKKRWRKGRGILLITALGLLLAVSFGWAEDARFAVVSDTHVGAPNSAYPAFIRDMEAEGISLIIHTGDAINNPGNKSQWRRFFEITGPGRILHLAAGNHDIEGRESLQVYLTFFPSPYHAFAEGDTLFILLNTELPGEEGMVAGEQLAWLETELERPFRYKFVFLHEPLFPVIVGHGLDRHKEARDVLHRLFVQRGVSLVVAGHDHIYQRRQREGITYVVAGAAGGSHEFFGKNGESFRYMVATRAGEGYSFVVRDMEGTVRDLFSVTDGKGRGSGAAWNRARTTLPPGTICPPILSGPEGPLPDAFFTS
jgi:3',5'-cyclic AMP phosphodiesterase CpdA